MHLHTGFTIMQRTTQDVIAGHPLVDLGEIIDPVLPQN